MCYHLSLTKKEKCNCYALDKFFVELVYDSEQNAITEFRSFKSGYILDKYAQDLINNIGYK